MRTSEHSHDHACPEMRPSEEMHVLTIEKIVEECKDTKTIIFKHHLDCTPGQFVIIWIPGINEKPLSISYKDNGRFGITVFSIGEFSSALNSLKVGDKVGMRGPYGRGYTVKKCNAVTVGGGYGSAPLAFLTNEIKKRKGSVDFITGAKTKDLLLFEERMLCSGAKYHPCTDDGSYGFQGFTTAMLEKILAANRNIGMVYTCGPEVMMKKVIDICDKYGIPCEVSVERYMKCGFGLCGQCCLDNTGQRSCIEGPVLTKEEAGNIFEFNKYSRSASGQKKPFGQPKPLS